jgi:DNA-binding transcriptional MerR regulator
MEPGNEMLRTGTYRIRQFAELAGVTVRALHHYDRLGLLKPRRNANGYRVYTAKDLEILEQIVALKFIGMPLETIKVLLRKNPRDIAAAFRAQRALLLKKKALLDQAIDVLTDAERLLQTGEQLDTQIFGRIIEVIEMQHRTDDEWTADYQKLLQSKIERLKEMSPEKKAALGQQWRDLFKDVQAALDLNPASPKAQELANRWVSLLGAFAPGGTVEPELAKKYGAAYSVPGEWPAGVRAPEGVFADTRVWDFIRRALAVR